MNLFKQLSAPGIYPLSIEGPVGNLEVELTIPEGGRSDRVALLGHPHSLQGGTMNNKVVTTMVRACKTLHIPSIRFNFRGVGQSAGAYDAGVGESEDMLLLAQLWKEVHPLAMVSFAGFSFGSFVAYRAACLFQQHTAEKTSLITIAPSVHHYNYKEFALKDVPWTVIHGDKDEIASAELARDFTQTFSPPLPFICFENTGHFFHGKLIELRDCLEGVLRSHESV